MDWLTQNLTSIIAVLVSVFTLVFTNISGEAATTANLQTRMDTVEERVLIVDNAIGPLTDRTSKLETHSAVTNRIMINLEGAVSELSENVKTLSSVATKVAVLDEKVDNLEDKVNTNHGAR